MVTEVRGAGLVTTAAAVRGAGVSRRQLEGGQFHRVRHGIYVPADADAADPDLRIRVAASVARGRYPLGGWAAARIHELQATLPRRGDTMTVFDGLVPWPEGRGELEPLLLCLGRHDRVARTPGIRPWRSELEPDDVVTVGGVRVTSPLRTAFDVARTRSRAGALVAVDRMLALGIVALEDLAEYAARQRGKRGVRRVLDVVALADPGAESPPESVVRLLWVEAGLPRPVANAEVHDMAGRFVARVDLLDPTSGLVVEYDGAYHASAAQRSVDSRREVALEALGHVVVKVTSVDLESPEARSRLAARLRAARTHALTRP